MKRPKFTVYAIVNKKVSVDKMKQHIKRHFSTQRISVLIADTISSVIFNVPMWRLNDTWTYLKKKRGVKKVWLGK